MWYLFILVYYFLSFTYLLFGVHNKRFIKCVLKCLPVVALLFQALVFLIQYSGSNGAKPEEVSLLKQFIWGLTFSAIGDGCLVFPRIFIAGILSFAVSLCIYINVLGLTDSLVNIGFGGVASGVCICILSLSILVIFSVQSRKVRVTGVTRHVLRVLLLIYFFILSTLLWSGVSLFLRQNNRVGTYSAIGASFFYISDVLIAASAILDFRILQGRYLIMLTYHTAQIFLAYSVYSRLDM